jgi:hypothetical protein
MFAAICCLGGGGVTASDCVLRAGLMTWEVAMEWCRGCALCELCGVKLYSEESKMGGKFWAEALDCCEDQLQGSGSP